MGWESISLVVTSWWVRVHVLSCIDDSNSLCYTQQACEYMLSCMFAFQGLTLQSSKAVSNAKNLGWPLTKVGEALYLTQAPGGYPFYIVDKEQPVSGGCN